MILTEQASAMIQEAYEEGRIAAETGRSFRMYCPYTFDHAGVNAVEFDRCVRPKMDAWFAGWKASLDVRGLGFNFCPRPKGTDE